MKIFVKEKQAIRETEVHVLCRCRNKEIEKLVDKLKQEDISIKARTNNSELRVLKLTCVLYFEVVDKRVFAYTAENVYETEYKLYQVESLGAGRHFQRISKSIIVNLRFITAIKPEEGRRLKVLVNDQEWLMVSRMYVNDLKTVLGI